MTHEKVIQSDRDATSSISGTAVLSWFPPEGLDLQSSQTFWMLEKRRFFVPTAESTPLAWAQIEEDEMPPFSDVKYVYDPETLTTMGAAFDAACQAFPPDLKDHEGARRRLALLILRHMDQGERDATRLSDLALLDFMRPLALKQQ